MRSGIEAVNAELVRRRVVVHGRVQGVFFRDTCRREARAHGVVGWVTNRPDGTVEAVFEGDAAGVQAMTDWCRRGPPYAIVDRIDLTDEPAAGEIGFSVR
jgi:acylphosphatase